MAAIESTLLMGLVLLVIIAAIGVSRDWERGPGSGEDRAESLVNAFRTPMAWTVIFVVFALVFSVAAAAFAAGSSVLGVSPALGELILVGGFAAIMIGFLFAGVYAGAKNRGMKQAQAAGASSLVLGFLFIFAIALLLLTA